LQPFGDLAAEDLALPERHLRRTRDSTQIDGFFSKRKRRESYFVCIDDAVPLLRKLLGGEPSMQDVRAVVAGALTADGSFDGYALKLLGRGALGDEDRMDELREAAAGCILQQYIEACKDGRRVYAAGR
jgi:hypothetical protein